MAHKIWHINDHTVELKHRWFSSPGTLTVDEELVFKRPVPPLLPLYFDFGFAHCFEIDGQPDAVRAICQEYKFRYELLTGKEAKNVVEANRLPFELQLGQLVIFFGGLIVAAIFLLLIIGFMYR